MTDYTKLVEALLSASTVSTAWGKLMRDAAAAIEALQANNDILHQHIKDLNEAFRVESLARQKAEVAQPHWVRCDEALPEIGQRVIVYDGWMQFMTRKDDQLFNGKMYWENEEGNWERVDYEAYWMPIEPPQEVQE